MAEEGGNLGWCGGLLFLRGHLSGFSLLSPLHFHRGHLRELPALMPLPSIYPPHARAGDHVSEMFIHPAVRPLITQWITKRLIKQTENTLSAGHTEKLALTTFFQ